MGLHIGSFLLGLIVGYFIAMSGVLKGIIGG